MSRGRCYSLVGICLPYIVQDHLPGLMLLTLGWAFLSKLAGRASTLCRPIWWRWFLDCGSPFGWLQAVSSWKLKLNRTVIWTLLPNTVKSGSFYTLQLPLYSRIQTPVSKASKSPSLHNPIILESQRGKENIPSPTHYFWRWNTNPLLSEGEWVALGTI